MRWLRLRLPLRRQQQRWRRPGRRRRTPVREKRAGWGPRAASSSCIGFLTLSPSPSPLSSHSPRRPPPPTSPAPPSRALAPRPGPPPGTRAWPRAWHTARTARPRGRSRRTDRRPWCRRPALRGKCRGARVVGEGGCAPTRESRFVVSSVTQNKEKTSALSARVSLGPRARATQSHWPYFLPCVRQFAGATPHHAHKCSSVLSPTPRATPSPAAPPWRRRLCGRGGCLTCPVAAWPREQPGARVDHRRRRSSLAKRCSSWSRG